MLYIISHLLCYFRLNIISQEYHTRKIRLNKAFFLDGFALQVYNHALDRVKENANSLSFRVLMPTFLSALRNSDFLFSKVNKSKTHYGGNFNEQRYRKVVQC